MTLGGRLASIVGNDLGNDIELLSKNGSNRSITNGQPARASTKDHDGAQGGNVEGQNSGIDEMDTRDMNTDESDGHIEKSTPEISKENLAKSSNQNRKGKNLRSRNNIGNRKKRIREYTDGTIACNDEKAFVDYSKKVGDTRLEELMDILDKIQFDLGDIRCENMPGFENVAAQKKSRTQNCIAHGTEQAEIEIERAGNRKF
ncbi:hypothetical protein FGB62_73g120 [Gracilaria domingensis]|nr:hypothetical protein FGB62_73g120 [Gracilaria domingensis]